MEPWEVCHSKYLIDQLGQIVQLSYKFHDLDEIAQTRIVCNAKPFRAQVVSSRCQFHLTILFQLFCRTCLFSDTQLWLVCYELIDAKTALTSDHKAEPSLARQFLVVFFVLSVVIDKHCNGVSIGHVHNFSFNCCCAQSKAEHHQRQVKKLCDSHF